MVIVGAEPHLPYGRPPLSKAPLTGERTAAQCALRAPETCAAEGITHFISKVDAIDAEARQLTLAAGRRFPYQALLLATGGQLRWIDIPGAHLPGVLGLRTLDDAAALAPRLVAGAHIVVIGGGFIDLEVVASARAHGCRVSVIEGAPRLLGRAVPESVGARAPSRRNTIGGNSTASPRSRRTRPTWLPVPTRPHNTRSRYRPTNWPNFYPCFPIDIPAP